MLNYCIILKTGEQISASKKFGTNMYYAIISTEINQKAAIGADGSAFYDAREIINF
jgi:hypothetical protein